MGGIISGFLGGTGDAMAQVGKMYFNKQIQDEMDEAKFLRDKELNRDNQSFRTSEREANQEFVKGQDKIKMEQSESLKNKDIESREKVSAADNEARLEVARINASKQSKKNPQLIKYTDSKGFEQQGVLKENEDGTFDIVHPENPGQVVEQGVSRDELKNMAAVMNSEEGKDSDWIPFNEYSPGDDAVRAKAAKNKGLIGGKMTAGQDRPKVEKQKSQTKKFGRLELTQDEYVKRMKQKFATADEADLIAQWNSK